MIKILIIDTQGSEITEEYRALLPGLVIRGIDLPGTEEGPCHPHGAWCGWLAGVPLVGAGKRAELVFVKVFDEDGYFVPGALEAVLDVIEEEQPTHISRSWGAWDGDNPIQELMGELEFEEWIAAFEQLQDEIGFIDFGAAGNDDQNDLDYDVDFPQCKLPQTNVIGACDRDGIPAPWSGDGTMLQCVMWADRVISPDITGEWSVWSGTSAATPKACGACAALGDTFDQWRYRIAHLPDSCRPVGDWDLPHPKWGYGCAEDLWQIFARRVSIGIMPPAVKADAEIVQHDYAIVPRKADEPKEVEEADDADDEAPGGD